MSREGALLADIPRGKADTSRGWGSVAQRARMAKGLPQALVKISSFSGGAKNVQTRLDYISREGELTLENEDGQTVKGKEATALIVEGWSADFGNALVRIVDGKKKIVTRDTANIVVSYPHGTNKKHALAATRHFLKDQFGQNHSYWFASHDDEKHFHLHAVIKTRGHDRQKLRTNKPDLRTWRERLAHHAKAQDIHLDASPRWARGQSLKAESHVRHQIRKVGRKVREWLTPPSATDKKVVERLKEIAQVERTSNYLAAAAIIHAIKPANDVTLREKVKDAQQLYVFANSLTVGQTRVQKFSGQKNPLRDDEVIKAAQRSYVRRLDSLGKSMPSNDNKKRLIEEVARLQDAIPPKRDRKRPMLRADNRLVRPVSAGKELPEVPGEVVGGEKVSVPMDETVTPKQIEVYQRLTRRLEAGKEKPDTARVLKQGQLELGRVILKNKDLSKAAEKLGLTRDIQMLVKGQDKPRAIAQNTDVPKQVEVYQRIKNRLEAGQEKADTAKVLKQGQLELGKIILKNKELSKAAEQLGLTRHMQELVKAHQRAKGRDFGR